MLGLTRSHHRSRPIKVAAAIAAVASLGALAACVLADPPPDLPKPQKHHPIIVKSTLSPPYTEVLPALPSRFVVAVELIDPDTPFVYEVFIDYDGTNPRQPPDLVPRQPITPTPATVDGGITTFDFDITAAAPDPALCHRIELLVALTFDLQAPHTPDSFGANSVVWYYNPSGDPGRCPLYDAGGADGAPPDQQSEVIFMPPPPDGGE